MDEKFSVLLSVYYKEKPRYLYDSLKSIFEQNLPPDEVVLVKDGPLTEELDAVIEQFCTGYSIIKVISLPENRGTALALNKGLDYCSHELIARMDSDDIAKPERFKKQLEVFKNNPDIDVVSAWIDEFEKDATNVVSTKKIPEYHEEIVRFARERDPVNHPVVMFKKQSVLDAGGYFHLSLIEDYYLWVRMILNGAKFYNIQESLLLFRSSLAMFRRRGGYKYAMNEFRLEKKFLQLKFISYGEFLRNVSIRFVVRIIPNRLRAFLYKKLLRR